MKKALAVLVLIGFVAMVATAADYHPTKDTFIRVDTGTLTPAGTVPGQTGGGLANYGITGFSMETYGGADQQRAGNWTNDVFLMGYDKAAILAEIAGNLGHAPTLADFQSGAAGFTVQLMAAGAEFNHVTTQYKIAAMISNTDWTPSGASYQYADTATKTLWNSVAGVSTDNGNHPWGANNTDYLGTFRWNGLDLGSGSFGTTIWAAADLHYQTFPVDPLVAYDYLTNPNAVALIPFGNVMSNGTGGFTRQGVDNNGYAFSSEGTVTLFGNTSYAGPVLTVVPEPCSMLLMAAGAVATLIRRRK